MAYGVQSVPGSARAINAKNHTSQEASVGIRVSRDEEIDGREHKDKTGGAHREIERKPRQSRIRLEVSGA